MNSILMYNVNKRVKLILLAITYARYLWNSILLFFELYYN